ncbi:transporter substrate-binding domain-containing protein [Aureimonas sp. AU12]|uniref:transporter substrate-binding domain-containing protein n=1 Tax=Aureimonas sp. AU12 TaxID=1638161 RepID=UPI000784BC65|nr:transporter substrate-binding domain-containing protein [Aureimonas sp. AU12]
MTTKTARTLGLAVAAIAIIQASASAGAMTLEEAKAAGKVRIGIQADNCPWGCLSTTGEARGFDATVGRAFAKSLGLEAEFVPLAVANRIPALTSNRVDMLIASVGITAERAKAVQFSPPYAANTLYLTAAKTTKLPDLASLSGITVGVPRSAPMDTILTRDAPSADIRRFDDDSANIQALLSGQVQAVGSNQFYIQRLDSASSGTYENKFPIGQLYQGVATRLGESDWNSAMTEFLKSYVGSEGYKASYAEWLKVPTADLPATIDGVSFIVSQ